MPAILVDGGSPVTSVALPIGALPALALGLSLQVLPAAAQPVPPGREGALAHLVPPEPGARACYERRYEADHLEAHPRQRVTAIALRIAYHRHRPERGDPPEGQRNYYFQLDVRMKGEAKRLTARGECTSGGGEIACALDCDGGGITVKRLDAARRIEIGFMEGQRIRMSRGCDSEGDTLDLTPGQDDHRFHLSRAASCPPYGRW